MRHGARRSLVWARTLLPLLGIAVAATVVALIFTPTVPVSVFGQTVEVGAVRPSFTLSGPGRPISSARGRWRRFSTSTDR